MVDEVACGMGKSQPDLTKVEPKGGSELLLEFETGERRLELPPISWTRK